MTPEQAEQALAKLSQPDIVYAVSTLARLTPSVMYQSANMHAFIPRGTTQEGSHLSNLDTTTMFVVCAAYAIEALAPDVTGAKTELNGHTDGGVETGNWALDVSYEDFGFTPTEAVHTPVSVLQTQPPAVLKKTLGRLIDLTQDTLVLCQDLIGNAEFSLKKATLLAGGGLHTLLSVGDDQEFVFTIAVPGAEAVKRASVVVSHTAGPDDSHIGVGL